MGRFLLILFLLILIGIGYLATLNKETITVAFSASHVYEAPKIVVMLVSGIIGGVFVFTVFLLRDTRRFIKNISQQKRQKREERRKELYAKALDLILAGKVSSAREILEAIIKDFPDFIDAYLRLSEVCIKMGDLSRAYAYVERARQLAPKRLDVLFTIETLMEKTGRWQDALKAVNEILELDRSNLSALYKKREILEVQERWEDLIDTEREIIKATSTELLPTGLQQENMKKREKRYLAGYKYELGRVSLEKKDLEKAKKAFKTALKIDRFFIPAYLGLVEVLLAEGLTEEAVEFLWNSYEMTTSPLLLARLEDLLISNGEPARLIRYYKSAISKRPADQLLNFLLGKLYYRLEMIDEAMEIFRQMETQGTTFPELHRLMGNLYLKRKQPERAAFEFRKAIDLRRTLRLNYCCQNCGYLSETWSGRCPNCKEWNSFTFNLEWLCRGGPKEVKEGSQLSVSH
jgi:lipopolysaccharide biosynthesis regulator YciM